MARNIVLIVWDDVGVDQLASYYPSLITPGVTPHFDARAASGVRFTRHTAMPSCKPSEASILTGLFPIRHGFGSTGTNLIEMSTDTPTIADAMAAGGYRTEMIGKWNMSGVTSNARDHALACGFTGFEGLFAVPASYYAGGYSWLDESGFSSPDVYLTTQEADRAIAKLSGSEPFFLIAFFNAPHLPYHCPPSEFGVSCGSGSDFDHFRAMLQVLDAETERLVSAIDLSDTVVLYTSDNGTPGNSINQGFPDNQAKNTAYGGGIRTHLAAIGAGIRTGVVSNAIVQINDLPATALELAGLPPMESAVDSVSFAPLIESATATPRRGFGYAERFDGTPPSETSHDRSAEDARYRLVRLSSGQEYLFDLVADGFETSPLDLAHLLKRETQSYLDLQWVIESRGSAQRVQTRKSKRVSVTRQT